MKTCYKCDFQAFNHKDAKMWKIQKMWLWNTFGDITVPLLPELLVVVLYN